VSRLRATLSSSPLDREIAQRVDQAQRAIQGALKLCDGAPAATPEGRRRVGATRRDLLQALGALASVRRTQPSYDTSDPDLTEAPPKPRDGPKLTPPDVMAEILRIQNGDD